MRKPTSSIDGFVPRAPRRSIGQTPRTTLSRSGESNRPVIGASSSQPEMTTLPPPRRVSRQEVDDSLKGIDSEPVAPKKRGFLRKKGPKKPVSKRKKIIKRVLKVLAILLVLLALYLGVTAFLNTTKIFKGNFLDIFQSKPLMMDQNGRTNILVFGTSGSIDDQRHDGANLTDTVLVLSIDQNKKDAYMVSLPRDLYVDYGDTCPEGNQGKINSMYECYSGGGTDDTSEQNGAKGLETKVTEVTGLTMQYYAHINWAVVVGAINAIGGVEVDVEGNGSCSGFGMPQGSIVDVNMNFRYEPGVRMMDGIEALKFSRARGSAGGCGLARGDYDRQANQQKVLKAMQKKAVSAQTLTDLSKVTGLLNALGQNLRTNFQTSEIQTLASLARDISSDKIVSIDLASEESRLIAGDMLNGASIQVPIAGMYDYSGIQSFINKKINSNPVSREDAHLALFNGSGVAGYGQQRSDGLSKLGFTITAVDNAPDGEYGRVELYDLTGDKPATKARLEKIYGVSTKTDTPPISVSADTDFILIYGMPDTAN